MTISADDTPRDRDDLSDLSPGSLEWFEAQRGLILSRPLIRRTYDQWYRTMLRDVASAPDRNCATLEIGSGAGYVKLIDPRVITSDIVEGLSDRVLDAQQLPFENESLRGVLLTHVFHHIPDVRQFLKEADRTLIPGGVLTMIDVAHTPLARYLFGNFHPEGYDSMALDWTLDESKPIGGANQALSWIVFCRDRRLFSRKWPNFRVECIEPLPWLGYALSGGVTRRGFVPSFAAPLIAWLDSATAIFNPLCSLHWHIRIRKIA